MKTQWTFGRKIAVGFSTVVALAFLMSAIATYALRQVVEAKDEVIELSSRSLADAERLRSAVEEAGAASRGYYLTNTDRYLDQLSEARVAQQAAVEAVRARARQDDERRALAAVERALAEHIEVVDELIQMRKDGATVDTIAHVLETRSAPRRQALDREIEALVQLEAELRDGGTKAASIAAERAVLLVLVLAVAVSAVAMAVAFLLTRALTRQIGAAVAQVQSSSSELQAAANQQASGAKEQSTAMTEISTTINELLVTSRQIAESAQRVARIAEETANSSRSGERTMQTTQESMAAIKRQVDAIVAHMVDLGKKSQQIGGILDLINELSEQTNILAINATIEAAGAGDSGRRFGVVADEIRKLADRVSGSTKDVRALIEDIRGSVNATVMATESGTKAVDAGARQFTAVAASLQEITSMVATTTEASREIVLSTKQQSTAVEQVNVAVGSVAQATRETEASANQTLQTSAELTKLSRQLLVVVQAEAPRA